MENRKKKKKIPTSRLAFLGVTRRTGNTFLLKDGLRVVGILVQGAYQFLKFNLRPFLRRFKTDFSKI